MSVLFRCFRARLWGGALAARGAGRCRRRYHRPRLFRRHVVSLVLAFCPFPAESRYADLLSCKFSVSASSSGEVGMIVSREMRVRSGESIGLFFVRRRRLRPGRRKRKRSTSNLSSPMKKFTLSLFFSFARSALRSLSSLVTSCSATSLPGPRRSPAWRGTAHRASRGAPRRRRRQDIR